MNPDSGELFELNAELQAARHELMVLELELRQAQSERNGAVREAKLHSAEAQGCRGEMARLSCEHQAEVARLSALLKQEQEALRAVRTSLSWRLTEPFRALREKMRGDSGS